MRRTGIMRLQNLLYLIRAGAFSLHRAAFPVVGRLGLLSLTRGKTHPSSSRSRPVATKQASCRCLAGVAQGLRIPRRLQLRLANGENRLVMFGFVWFGFQQMYSQITSFDGDDGERKENHPHHFLNVIQRSTELVRNL